MEKIINKKIEPWSYFFLLLLFNSCMLCSQEKNIADFEIVRVDSINNRVFVVVDSNVVLYPDSLQIIINKIYNESVIGQKLSKYNLKISIFRDKKYAKYKTEIDWNFVEQWMNNYYAEFTSKDSTCWTYPMLFKKKKKLYFHLMSDTSD